MVKSNLLLFAFILLIAFSCKKVDVDALLNSNEPIDTLDNPIDTTTMPIDTVVNSIDTIYSDTTAYFPLSIGNYWNYWQNNSIYNELTGMQDLDQYSFSQIVYTDSLVNEFQYYVVKESNTFNDLLYRIEGKHSYQLENNSFTNEPIEIKIIDENLNNWYSDAFPIEINSTTNDTILKSYVFTRASFDYFDVEGTTYNSIYLIRRTSIFWQNNFDESTVENNTFENSSDFLSATSEDVYYAKNIGKIFTLRNPQNSEYKTTLNNYSIQN